MCRAQVYVGIIVLRIDSHIGFWWDKDSENGYSLDIIDIEGKGRH